MTLDGSCVGCMFADNELQGGGIILNAGAHNNTIEVEDAVVTDNSGAANYIYDDAKTVTPFWTGSVSNPVLGNGTLTGRAERRGKSLMVDIKLTIGSSTTLGSGTWFFGLNSGGYTTLAAFHAVGSVVATHSGAVSVGAAVVNVGESGIACYIDGGTAFDAAEPWAWGAGDTLSLSMEIPLY